MKRKLPTLVRPSNYHPLLSFQVGSNEVATGSLSAIKRDFRALGRLVKGSGAEVIFFSILPVAGNDEGRNRKSQKISTWLQAWCHCQNFEFFDHGSVCDTTGLWATDGVHLCQRGKKIFA